MVDYQALKHKIEHTALFTPKEKIKLLSTIDTVSIDDAIKLEAIIDEYDKKYQAIVNNFQVKINEALDSMDAQASPDEKDELKVSTNKIRSGLSQVVQEMKHEHLSSSTAEM